MEGSSNVVQSRNKMLATAISCPVGFRGTKTADQRVLPSASLALFLGWVCPMNKPCGLNAFIRSWNCVLGELSYGKTDRAGPQLLNSNAHLGK